MSCDMGWEQGWFAVYTRARHEHAVERYLQRKNLVTYLPLKKVWSTRRDRRKKILLPALPGYLFIRCAMTPDVRAEVKKAPGVVSLISTDGIPSRIPDDQINSLRILLESELEVETLSRFEPGKLVRIRSGPLAGASGILERVNPGKNRLIVRIDTIGMACSVDIHEADVELVAD
ncbi:MAG: UpxY family transcription antiterminator [Chthonomonadales bacterium]